MYYFSYCESVAGRAQLVTRQNFEELLARESVRATCAQIASLVQGAGDQNTNAQALQDAVGGLKRRLPAFCWHAWFDEGVRKNDRAHASGLVMIDLDHLEDPVGVWGRIKPSQTEPSPDPAITNSQPMYVMGHRLLAAHVTPSTRGLRLVFEQPEGTLSLEDAQAIIARDLGLTQVDTCTKDRARLSFCVPASYWLWIDTQGLFEGEAWREGAVVGAGGSSSSGGSGIPGSPGIPGSSGSPGSSGGSSGSSCSDGADTAAASYPTNYDLTLPQQEGAPAKVSIPYSTLVEALEEQLGGTPAHGSRNNFIFAMAAYLRYVCDDDPEWIARVLPTYGENRERWRRTIDSACQRSQLIQMPQIVRRAIEQARKRVQELAEQEAVEYEQETTDGQPLADGMTETGDGQTSATEEEEKVTPPPMPQRLPKLISHLIKNVPEVCKPAVANAVFPALAAHLKGVKFWLIDGTEKEATFMCVTMAKQSSGKSSVNKPIEYIVADIVKRDELSRLREQEWKDAMILKGANKQKPPRPDDLCVQVLVSDMTNAAFVQRMKDANGRYLYTNLEELELLRQVQTNGSKDVGKIICLCFDNGKYGQERVGLQSVTARVELRWNWNASSTIQRGIRFFDHRLVDGTLSRINLCTIVPDPSQPFVYGRYDDRFGEVLKPYIDNLNVASGHVQCRQALELARRLDEQCQEEGALCDDEVYQDLAHRAVTIAYLKAMVLYVANGMKWSREIGEFAEWSLAYDLWCKCHFFGQKIAEATQGEILRAVPGRQNLLQLLPSTFSRQQADVVRRQCGLKGDAMGMLRLWVFRGYILRNSDGTYTKTPRGEER